MRKGAKKINECIFYIGRVKLFSLMLFLAMYKVVLALIESGARFQILAESLIKDESKIWQPVDSFSMFSLEALVLLSSIA